MSYTAYGRKRYRGLGKGWKGKHRSYASRQPYRRGPRQFVPRTMGAFANSESKYFDSFLNAQAMPEGTGWAASELDPATLDTLFVPQEGSDINNRIGRKVSVYKMAIRGVISQTLSQEAADMTNSAAHRLILYCDKQTNGEQVQAEILMASPGAASVPLKFSTFQNLAGLGRFQVLKDITIRGRDVNSFNDAAATGTLQSPDIPFKMTVNFKKPLVIRFNATNAGSIGDIVDNSLHLIGTKSTSTGVHTISYQVRTYYKDA